MSQFLELYQQLGSEAFSESIGAVAPYFASIDPLVVELKPHYCEVALKNQSKVHNHLGTVHAIAMCNAAELAGGMTTDVSIPKGSRWIPQGMSVQYLAKAKTDLKVVCDAADIDFSEPGEITVPVAAFDTDNTKVFAAQITMNVKAG